MGKDALRHLISNVFDGENLTATIKQVCQYRIICAQINLEGAVSLPPLLKPVQRHGSYLGEDWQLDFTQMRKTVLQNRMAGSTWVAQLVKHQTLAQIMISQFVSLSSTSGSVLTAQSLEHASDSVVSLLSAPLRLLSQK